VFVVPYVTFGGFWVQFHVGVIYFWCMYILFMLRLQWALIVQLVLRGELVAST